MTRAYTYVAAPALAAVLLSVSMTSEGAAQRRPDVRTMTCEQARDLVVRSGSIVVTTGRHTYDLYIAHRGMCMRPHLANPAWVTTRDTPRCLIGYQCAQGD